MELVSRQGGGGQIIKSAYLGLGASCPEYDWSVRSGDID